MSGSIWVSTSVEVDIDDIVDELSETEKAKLVAAIGGTAPPGFGDGDAARAENLIERAYLAARRMADLPAEVRDLFWHVHGRAI